MIPNTPPSRPLPLVAFAAASLLPLPLLGLGAVYGGAWVWGAVLYMAVLTLVLDQVLDLSAVPELLADPALFNRQLCAVGAALRDR